MPGTTSGSDQWIAIGDEKYELVYSMLSLEKIEGQFGSVAGMQAMITNERGEVQLDQPVVRLLIDVLHAGLLHVFDDTPEARRVIATGMRPADLEDIVEAFTAAFTDSFGAMGERVLGEDGESVTPQLRPMNRADRRASHSPNGTTSPRSSSGAVKKSGKK